MIPAIPAGKRATSIQGSFLPRWVRAEASWPFPKNKSSSAKETRVGYGFLRPQGKVKLTVVSKSGKEATLGILGEGDFFGEGGLAGQPLRMGSAGCPGEL